jgi:hypothetical protein
VNAGRVLPLVVLSAIVLIGTGALAPVPFLRVDVAGGDTVHLALPAEGWFNYRYRHSVYDAEVDELYRVESDALHQVAIQSEDRRALEYYGLPSEPERRGSGFVIPGRAEPIREIALQVLRDQTQALVFGGKRFDLSAELGDARLTLRPVQRARVSALLPGTR